LTIGDRRIHRAVGGHLYLSFRAKKIRKVSSENVGYKERGVPGGLPLVIYKNT
jgi:hypothetical protein